QIRAQVQLSFWPLPAFRRMAVKSARLFKIVFAFSEFSGSLFRNENCKPGIPQHDFKTSKFLLRVRAAAGFEFGASVRAGQTAPQRCAEPHRKTGQWRDLDLSPTRQPARQDGA